MLKFILISILLVYTESQYAIPEVAHLSLVVHDDKGPVYYINEHLYHEYKSLVMRNSHDQKPVVYLPYSPKSVLAYEKEDGKCSVQNKAYDTISFVDAINACIKKKTEQTTQGEIVCKEGSIFFYEKRVDGQFLPKNFTGLGLPDKHFAYFEKIDYFYTPSLINHLNPVPNGVSCQGLTKADKLQDHNDYLVVKDDSEFIRVKYDDTYLNFLLEKNRTKHVFLIDEAQVWTIGEKCEKKVIDILSSERKYTEEELSEILWRENVLSKHDFYITYTFPEIIAGNLLVKRARLESETVNATIFGDKHDMANIFIKIDPDSLKTGVIEVHQANKKKAVYKFGIPPTAEDFYGNLYEEKMRCSSVYKSKRLTFLSEELPKREKYDFDNIASVTKTLADAMSSYELFLSPLRISEMFFQVKNMILSIDVKISESDAPDSKFHKFSPIDVHFDQAFNLNTSSISDCFLHCDLNVKCGGVSFQDNVCHGLANITYKGIGVNTSEIYMYMPYIREIPIAVAKQVFKARNPPLISIDKNQVKLVKVIDSIVGVSIVDEENFNSIFKLDQNFPCDKYINLNMPMTYQECGRKSKSYSKNIAISGFVYTVSTNACKLCRSDSTPSGLNDQGEYKFRFNFDNAFDRVFERKIKQDLLKANLYSVSVGSHEECAEKCELHSDFTCISFFQCNNECFLTDEYSIEKYNVETKEASDMCNASRKAETTLFTRSPVKFVLNTLETFEKVETSKAVSTTMDTLKNAGYITCPNNLNISYIVSTANLKNAYEWHQSYNLTCDFHKRISTKTSVLIENDIIEIVEIGHTKGGVAGIVISLFLISLVAALGITYFVKRRS